MTVESNDPVLLLESLSTTELDHVHNEIKLVLIPIGSIEQHGPNLSLNTDTILAKSASQYIASRMYPNVIVAPEVCWGISHHHMSFPGTITVRESTLISLLTDIVDSLTHHGFERFLIINGHSGNRDSLHLAINQIYRNIKLAFIGSCQYFDLGSEKGAGHAAEMEVSFAYALAPELVKEGHLIDGDLTDHQRIDGLDMPWMTEQFSNNGPSGPIGNPSAELGWARLSPSFDNLLRITQKICNGELDNDQMRSFKSLEKLEGAQNDAKS